MVDFGSPSSIATALAGGGGLSSALGSTQDSVDSIYTITPTNWYKTLPYGFVFFDRSVNAAQPTVTQSGSTIFYLPISPSNINVVTHFATNIVTTLYGVVEEHSEVRYYDITINGTTGFAPRFNKEKQNAGSDSIPNALNPTEGSGSSVFINPKGRSSFENFSVDLGGFLPEITNTINQVVGIASDIAGFLGGGSGNETGITPSQNGYVAFHNFYRYLLKYKLDMAGLGKNGGLKRKVAHPLQFLNYKDGIKYDCVPLTFTLTRSNQSPMLYNYNIKMRCYNMRNVNGSPQEQDQLGKLGLGSIEGQSIFSSLAGAAGSAATLVSSIF